MMASPSAADPIEIKYINNPLALLSCPVVQLEGLVSRPELNGRVGFVLADTKLGRVYVRIFTPEARTLSIKKRNTSTRISWLPLISIDHDATLFGSCHLCNSIIDSADEDNKTYRACCGKFVCSNCALQKDLSMNASSCLLCNAPPPRNKHEARARALHRLFRFGDLHAAWAVTLSLRSDASDAYARMETLTAGLGHRQALFHIATEEHDYNLLQALSSDSRASSSLRNQAAAAALRNLH
uniref:Uncharacterized protein n=1 Tax=Aureoumbra lagunensis TaxID=44058 RepID=A0A7S3K456_9STRA|mmetsp:Transcript_12841/g.16060  ORF Transcript_12841/g.16060 Transcript_12841/m.16060 type:complete len:240 (-) Transcript_12841:162-881(-)